MSAAATQRLEAEADPSTGVRSGSSGEREVVGTTPGSPFFAVSGAAFGQAAGSKGRSGADGFVAALPRYGFALPARHREGARHLREPASCPLHVVKVTDATLRRRARRFRGAKRGSAKARLEQQGGALEPRGEAVDWRARRASARGRRSLTRQVAH